ncbi:Bug family tripartite tricarboxylate transporter substrate binding protein [Cupriavidus sp.]|uniref:Bug family tripartite tricarboxylate transporter substrate binding protein n=1 Tax=Cupriavidus sp. TaxID=1873897 RepID=UPI003D0A0B3E
MKRRTLIQAGIATLSIAGTRTWAQQNYPSRVIRLINPFPAGGTADVVGRKVAEMLTVRLGQPVIVENKAGANGAIGTAEVARAPADGYTLGIAIADSVISVASLVKKPGYDVRKDLTPLFQVMEGQMVLFANRQLGVKSLRELCQAARANPGKITFGSWGTGTAVHQIMVILERSAGVSFLHVPYKGAAPAFQDIVGNNINITAGPPALVAQYVQKGYAQPLAVQGAARSGLLPDVPTYKEQGVDAPLLQTTPWIGLVAPKGLPVEVQMRLVSALNDVCRTPDYEKFLNTSIGGARPTLKEPAPFARDIAVEFAMTNDLLRSMGVEPQ